MRYGIQETLGKCIKAVIVAESPNTPKKQAFLIFTDDTHFEFYHTESGFAWTARVDPGGIDKVRSYIANFPEARIVYEGLS